MTKRIANKVHAQYHNGGTNTLIPEVLDKTIMEVKTDNQKIM